LKQLFLFIFLTLVAPLALASYPDPCEGRYDGTWSFGHGESMSLRVIRTTEENVDVVVTTKSGYETTHGTCHVSADNSGRILFQGSRHEGDVRLFANGRASGRVTGFAFRGTKATSNPGPRPPAPPPMPPRPRPTPIPEPQPQPADVCDGGEIFGRWGFTGNERPLSLFFRRLGYDQVEVTFSSLGQVEYGRGFCQQDLNTGATLIGFRTQFNEGRMDVDTYGSVRGGISGAPFSGSVRQ
jgi:hypothetical protein